MQWSVPDHEARVVHASNRFSRDGGSTGRERSTRLWRATAFTEKSEPRD